MTSTVELEISTKCTIGCTMCPRNQAHSPRHVWDYGYMDINLIKQVIADQSFGKYLIVGCYGDAIYHPHFYEICELLIESNKPFMIETNGSHRTNTWWDKIASLNWHSAKTTWTFSIDGLKDTNHLYRKNSDWDSIMYGINKLVTGTSKPIMVWKYIVFPYNQHQVTEAKQLSQSLGFDQFKPVTSLRIYDGLSYDDRMLYDLEFYNENKSAMLEQNI